MKGMKVPVKLYERQLIRNNWLPVLSSYFSTPSYDLVFIFYKFYRREWIFMKYYFEKYKEEYFKVLYEMKKDNFKWYVEKLYGWDEETQTQFQKDFIEEHRNDINVIKVDNEIIGVFTNYINENNESVISLFYIDKKYQRQGIGTEILQKQLEIDRNNNRNTILQVFKENPARFLYKKVGFEVYEETQTHYKMRRKVKG